MRVSSRVQAVSAAYLMISLSTEGKACNFGRCVVRSMFSQLARAQGLDLTGCDDAWGHRYRGADRSDKGEDGKNGKETGEPSAQTASSRS